MEERERGFFKFPSSEKGGLFERGGFTVLIYFSEFRSYPLDFLPADSPQSSSTAEFGPTQPWQDLYKGSAG